MRILISLIVGIFAGAFLSYRKGFTDGRVQQRKFDEPVEKILQRKKK